uniref:Glycosyltransferase n=1 Tax=Eucalyptus perriniana TaxID=183845 RepID=Q5CD69_9MYRT|nr:monoterpene glucosyltransferase [Eucalyptus perriniana]
MAPLNYLVVAFPAQGLINPALQIAKRLLHAGAHVTFATAGSAYRRMAKSDPPEGLSFASFSDGSDEGLKPGIDFNQYMVDVERLGSETLRDLVVTSLNEGRKFACIFYTTIIPWVAQVAHSLQIPSTLIWTQPATLLDIYYYYFNGYGDIIRNLGKDDPSALLHLPGLPPLTPPDIPSFFTPDNQYAFTLPLMQMQFELFKEEKYPRVLVNTFDALEPGPLKAIGNVTMFGIGPLIPSAFLDGQDPLDKSFGGDLFQGSKGYIQWLDTKPKGSVIYVSFGSISVLSKAQKEEMARGLLGTGHPFLWVIRKDKDEEGEGEQDHLSCMEELEQKGMIVPWCSQVEVLSHASVGCFVTHSGWNSTFESLACGVPMVAFPQWNDQLTNAMLVENEWKVGVRVNVNEGGVVEGDEIKRCLELVVGDGEQGEEIRRNAKKWKHLAREAAKEGGSSDRNLKAFLEEIQIEANGH